MRRRRRAAARSASDAPRDLYGRSTPRGGPREIVSTLGDRPECSSSRVQDGPGAETIVAVGHTSPRAHFLPRSTGETPAQSPGGGWRRAAAVPGRRLAASGWPGRVASCGGRADHGHGSARRNWWGPPFDGSSGCEQVHSLWSSPSPSLAGRATCEPGSRDRPEDRSSNRSGGSTCPFGQDEMYDAGSGHDKAFVHECQARRV